MLLRLLAKILFVLNFELAAVIVVILQLTVSLKHY